MEKFCENVVSRYFDASLTMAEKTQDMDKKTTDAIFNNSGDIEDRVKNLASWIRSYKIHRVGWEGDNKNGDKNFASAASRTAIGWFDRNRDKSQSVTDAYKSLRYAVGDLYAGAGYKDRSFQSLTSKILWCSRPDEVPIYDLFASQAVTFLIKIYKSYQIDLPYRNVSEERKYNKNYVGAWKDLKRADKDIWLYTDFFHSHAILYKIFEREIEKNLAECRLEGRGNGITSFRLFDKFLWLFGNQGLDYSLIGESDGW